MRALIRALVFGVLLLSALLLSGCAEIPDAVQSRYSQPVGEIHGSRTVGQTFVAHENGLSRVDVLLATYARKNTHPVTFRLKEGPDAAEDIATIIINAAGVKDNAFHQFKFAPIPDSKDRVYFFAIESPRSVPGNAITIWHDPDDAYDEGAMVVNGQAMEGDLAFRTYHGGGWRDLVSSISSSMGHGLALLVLATLLFVLPGYAFLVLLSPGEEFDFTQRLILSIGLGVALFPLLLFVSSNLGFSLDGVKVAGLLVVCGGISCWGLLRFLIFDFRFPIPESKIENRKSEIFSRSDPVRLNVPTALLVFVFAVCLAVRLLMIRGMLHPAWSDSYHHTIISQMIADEGMIPDSYRPYISVDTFAYHFGFHSTVAFFHWVSGMGIPQAVLVVGQILNALSVLTIYLLAHYLTKDRWAALAGALISGLLSVMPAYYVNWGRYPQLGGQVIFPVAAVLTIKYLGTVKLDYRCLILTALATTGLFLAHYRVLLFYGLFVAVYLFGQSWLARREPRKVVNLWGRLFLVGLLSLIILAPWLKLVITDFTARIQQAQAQGFQLDPTYSLVTWDIITSLGLRPLLLAMAALGALWGFWRRDKYAILLAVWTVSLFALANPHVLGLPGAGLVNNGTVVMALYIPGSILAGFFLSYLGKTIVPGLEGGAAPGWLGSAHGAGHFPSLGGRGQGRVGLPLGYALAVLVILVSLWGAGDMLQLLTPEKFFVTPSDLKAMAWIRDNIPQDARFAINTQFWLSYAAIGTDAGYWIPFLTGRETTLPPMLYSEGTYEYIDEVNALARATARLCENDDTLPTLRENGVTHVYVGQRGGCLRPQMLLASPNYEAIYHQDGVWVFEIEYSPQT